MPAASVPKARPAETRRRASPRAKARPSRTPGSHAGIGLSGLIAGIGTGAGVRWDRVGRIAMMLVLGALVYLYLSAGIHMLSTWQQARTDSGAVVAMEREHRLLMRQHEALGKQGTLEAEARRLGMVNKGEQQYILSGLPNN